MSSPAQLSFVKQKVRNQNRLGQKTFSLNSEDFDYWIKRESHCLSQIKENSFVYETVTVKRTLVTKKELIS